VSTPLFLLLSFMYRPGGPRSGPPRDKGGPDASQSHQRDELTPDSGRYTEDTPDRSRSGGNQLTPGWTPASYSHTPGTGDYSTPGTHSTPGYTPDSGYTPGYTPELTPSPHSNTRTSYYQREPPRSRYHVSRETSYGTKTKTSRSDPRYYMGRHISVSRSKTHTMQYDTPEDDRHYDPVFDPVYETPSSVGTPTSGSRDAGYDQKTKYESVSYTEDSIHSGQKRKRKFTAYGVAQPRKEKKSEGKQVRDDLFHNFEEVSDFICDFHYKSQVVNVKSMPKFLDSSDFRRGNFFLSHNLTLSEATEDEGLLVNNLSAMDELVNSLPGSRPGNASKLIMLPQDDPLLHDFTSESIDLALKQAEEKEEQTAKTEALFLRRTMLITNDLVTDGMRFKHGIEGAEKAIVREVIPEDTKENILKRVNNTFKTVKKNFKHPKNPNLKIKRTLEFIPNRELWAHPYAQMKFDEAPSLPEERQDEIPSIIYKATPTPRLTGFAVFQHQKETGLHELERSYAWDNQMESTEEKSHKFMLLEWPAEDSCREAVLFSKISGKLRLKKLTARVQKQKKAYEKQVFGTEAMRIIWRDPMDREMDADGKLTECLNEEIPLSAGVGEGKDDENASKENTNANILNAA